MVCTTDRDRAIRTGVDATGGTRSRPRQRFNSLEVYPGERAYFASWVARGYFEVMSWKTESGKSNFDVTSNIYRNRKKN